MPLLLEAELALCSGGMSDPDADRSTRASLALFGNPVEVQAGGEEGNRIRLRTSMFFSTYLAASGRHLPKWMALLTTMAPYESLATSPTRRTPMAAPSFSRSC
jgi:hypothetical protein